MKKFPFILLAMLFIAMLIPNASDAQVIVRTEHVAPGVTIVKTKPIRPGQNYTWVDGHWDYNPRLGVYTFVEGYWIKRRKTKKVRRVHHQHARCH